MTKNRTISYEEHFVQVGFYQSILKEKESEIKKLKDQLKLSNDLLIFEVNRNIRNPVININNVIDIDKKFSIIIFSFLL